MIKTQKETKQHKMFTKNRKKEKESKTRKEHQAIFPQAPKQKKAGKKNKELCETGNSCVKRFCNNKTVQIA